MFRKHTKATSAFGISKRWAVGSSDMSGSKRMAALLSRCAFAASAYSSVRVQCLPASLRSLTCLQQPQRTNTIFSGGPLLNRTIRRGYAADAYNRPDSLKRALEVELDWERENERKLDEEVCARIATTTAHEVSRMLVPSVAGRASGTMSTLCKGFLTLETSSCL